MKKLTLAVTALCAISAMACTKICDNSTVEEFDLSRYLGEWYEIARYNHSFERGMDNTRAGISRQWRNRHVSQRNVMKLQGIHRI